jgi:FtsZ-binding cell division protein ZapB
MVWQEANKRFITAYTSQDTSAGALTVSDYADLATNNLKILSTTNSTSPTTGALVVSGGAGIAGALNTSGYIYTSSTIQANSGFYGTLQTASQPNITSVGTLSSLSIGNAVSYTSHTATIGGSLNIGDNIFMNASGGDATLYINGSTYTTWSSYRYYSKTSSGDMPSGDGYLSIYCAGRVLASEFDAFSDFRLKENIKPIELELAKSFVKNIIPKKFNWKTESKECINFGYIAQDILKSDIPELVMVNTASDVETEEYIDPIDGFVSPAGEMFTLSYTQIIGILHVTIKDLYQETEQLKSETAELKSETAELKSETAELKSETDNIKIDNEELKSENAELKAEIQNQKNIIDSILLRLSNLENK